MISEVSISGVRSFAPSLARPRAPAPKSWASAMCYIYIYRESERGREIDR